MSFQLNHTIVHAADREAAARFLVELFALPEPEVYGPFLVVRTANGVSLDVMKSPEPIASQHYAFLVSEEDFDAVFARIRARGIDYWADPFHCDPNQINHNDGGRGVYFLDPSGHALEMITKPYGSGE